MPHLKLTYFDFPGGRGEAAGLALAIGGIAFEDHRLPVAEWAASMQQTPFHALPKAERPAQCWCVTRTFPAALLAKAPADACICARCLDRATKDEA